MKCKTSNHFHNGTSYYKIHTLVNSPPRSVSSPSLYGETWKRYELVSRPSTASSHRSSRPCRVSCTIKFSTRLDELCNAFSLLSCSRSAGRGTSWCVWESVGQPRGNTESKMISQEFIELSLRAVFIWEPLFCIIKCGWQQFHLSITKNMLINQFDRLISLSLTE